MKQIYWRGKFDSTMSIAYDLFKTGNKNIDLSTAQSLARALKQLPLVGYDLESDISGGWDDDEVESYLPEVLHEWLVCGYGRDSYEEWTPPQLMAAYAAYLVEDAKKRFDEIAQEGKEYNFYGWSRSQTIDHCASSIIAAMEACHFGRLLQDTEIKIDPEKLAELMKKHASIIGKKAADTRHSKPGGSREKQNAIRAIWATGKYTSRDICAEQESAALGMSFSTARKALRGTPDPA